MKGLDQSWQPYLKGEFDKPYMKELKSFLSSRLKAGATVFPHGKEIFNAFNSCPFNKVKVVVIGQDPYHGPGQAHGLSFSVKPHIPIPPSLRNIYKEIERDLQLEIPNHGFLDSWAKQGVFLLNAVLTVEEGKAGAHQGKGWELFTDKVVDVLNKEKENLVFLLWGSNARKKAINVDRQKHLVLESVHPSPLSAYRGFLGCGHFSQANNYLEQKKSGAIDWSVPGHV